MVPRLKSFYREKVVPQLMSQFGYKNGLAVPRLDKIVVNVGVSDAREDIKAVDAALEEISAITGQKPRVARAKKSISNFKLRQGMPIGVQVTMRKQRMYEFFDRLVSIAVPRIRDFRGFEPNSFDGHGNYNLGLKEQHIFMEIDLEKSTKIRGMNITVGTTAKSDEEARALLSHLGLPFRKHQKKETI
ncbi:MAG: 50S ribosomal protein L5 [Elusimicrobia bacterium]|nr:50S ribosomal protein L5 [Elusimicrobiota bacterium]MBI3012357.1 50S ribosomal protein L5 [Elusimicrobiota bacterium]MBI4217723.1 50S ribosomal protein L5 [Elusimicrobiota bacterium]